MCENGSSDIRVSWGTGVSIMTERERAGYPYWCLTHIHSSFSSYSIDLCDNCWLVLDSTYGTELICSKKSDSFMSIKPSLYQYSFLIIKWDYILYVHLYLSLLGFKGCITVKWCHFLISLDCSACSCLHGLNPIHTGLILPVDFMSFVKIAEDVCDLNPMQICHVCNLT